MGIKNLLEEIKFIAPKAFRSFLFTNVNLSSPKYGKLRLSDGSYGALKEYFDHAVSNHFKEHSFLKLNNLLLEVSKDPDDPESYLLVGSSPRVKVKNQTAWIYKIPTYERKSLWISFNLGFVMVFDDGHEVYMSSVVSIQGDGQPSEYSELNQESYYWYAMDEELSMKDVHNILDGFRRRHSNSIPSSALQGMERIMAFLSGGWLTRSKILVPYERKDVIPEGQESFLLYRPQAAIPLHENLILHPALHVLFSVKEPTRNVLKM